MHRADYQANSDQRTEVTVRALRAEIDPGLPRGKALKVKVGGRPAYTSSVSGITDGVPPGSIMVVDPGAPTVQA